MMLSHLATRLYNTPLLIQRAKLEAILAVLGVMLMPALREPLNLGDLLKYEEESLLYSRDQVTVASGQNLELGAVVGRVTATQKVKRFDPAATDGTQVPVGIVLEPVDAPLADREDGLLLARHGIVASHAVVWPAGTTPEQKAAAIAALEARGLLIRQAA